MRKRVDFRVYFVKALRNVRTIGHSSTYKRGINLSNISSGIYSMSKRIYCNIHLSRNMYSGIRADFVGGVCSLLKQVET